MYAVTNLCNKSTHMEFYSETTEKRAVPRLVVAVLRCSSWPPRHGGPGSMAPFTTSVSGCLNYRVTVANNKLRVSYASSVIFPCSSVLVLHRLLPYAPVCQSSTYNSPTALQRQQESAMACCVTAASTSSVRAAQTRRAGGTLCAVRSSTPCCERLRPCADHAARDT